MRYIGDVHGKTHIYEQIASQVEESVQVGDLGVGFVEHIPTGERHRFIRGNHDNPHLCKRTEGWIPDGHIENDTLFVGGAWSIDQMYRTQDVDWWVGEECGAWQFIEFVNACRAHRPRIVVTHDCPDSVVRPLRLLGMDQARYRTRTGDGLQRMFEAHQPDIWIFGHWHQSRDQVIEGTRFICLAELEHIDL